MLVLGETGGTKFSMEQNVPRAVTIDRDLDYMQGIGSIDLVRWIVLDRPDVSIVILLLLPAAHVRKTVSMT